MLILPLPLVAGYPAAQSSTQSYSQSTQGYGASGYDTAPSAATPAASQSYGGQSAYTAQTAYPGYGQQAAPTAPQAYVSTYSCSFFLRLEKLFGPCLLSHILSFKVFPLSASVTVPTASHPVTVRIVTPSQRHMANNNKVTRLNRAATASSRAIHNKASSNKLHLLIRPRALVPTASLHLTNTASQADHPTTTSPTITVNLVHFSFTSQVFFSIV